MNLGTKFEHFFSNLHKLKRVPGSGNQPFKKLDVQGVNLLLELKATQNESFRLTKDILNDTYDAVYGPGGVGGDYIPAVVICLVEGDEPAASDKRYFVFEEDDIIRAFKEEREFFPASKADTRLQQAEIPGLFRDTQKGE